MFARQVLLVAASDLHAAGYSEFSEFSLTVAAWKRDARTFGLRGFSDRHPDHKRVYTEIVGAKRSGRLEKVRANHYRLTPLGLAEAARLNDSGKGKAVDHYSAVARYVRHPVYLRWCQDPEQPRDWSSVTAFLGLPNASFADESAATAARNVYDSCRNALAWCNRLSITVLTGSDHAAKPISYTDVAGVLSFLTALEYRFPRLKGFADAAPSKR
jgi:hypothetical protein